MITETIRAPKSTQLAIIDIDDEFGYIDTIADVKVADNHDPTKRFIVFDCGVTDNYVKLESFDTITEAYESACKYEDEGYCVTVYDQHTDIFYSTDELRECIDSDNSCSLLKTVTENILSDTETSAGGAYTNDEILRRLNNAKTAAADGGKYEALKADPTLETAVRVLLNPDGTANCLAGDCIEAVYNLIKNYDTPYYLVSGHDLTPWAVGLASMITSKANNTLKQLAKRKSTDTELYLSTLFDIADDCVKAELKNGAYSSYRFVTPSVGSYYSLFNDEPEDRGYIHEIPVPIEYIDTINNSDDELADKLVEYVFNIVDEAGEDCEFQAHYDEDTQQIRVVDMNEKQYNRLTDWFNTEGWEGFSFEDDHVDIELDDIGFDDVVEGF